jgi:hypothetical protein
MGAAVERVQRDDREPERTKRYEGKPADKVSHGNRTTPEDRKIDLVALRLSRFGIMQGMATTFREGRCRPPVV